MRGNYAFIKSLFQYGGVTRVDKAASWVRKLTRDSRGVLLLETIIAVMVFSLVGVAVLAGLSTAYTAGSKSEEQAVAETIGRNQMEYTFSQAFQPPGQTPYLTYTGVPAGYAVSVIAEEVNPATPDPNIERVTVKVTRGGKEILELKTLRFNQE